VQLRLGGIAGYFPEFGFEGRPFYRFAVPAGFAGFLETELCLIIGGSPVPVPAVISTSTLCVAIGMESMIITSRTSRTSISGVMLRSDSGLAVAGTLG